MGNQEYAPKVGDLVVDQAGNQGVVDNADDPHNIEVTFCNGGGLGLYCIVPDCEYYDGLFN